MPTMRDCVLSTGGLLYDRRRGPRLRPGAEPGPTNGPPGWAGIYRGYLVIVFPQDAGTFQTLIVRAGDDTVLAQARHEEVFDVVARAIPSIAVWVDPDRATPQTPPMAGSRLLNSYRGQLTDDGRVGVHGLIFVGDAVLTTNPAAGRGVTTSMMQARQLLAILDAVIAWLRPMGSCAHHPTA